MAESDDALLTGAQAGDGEALARLLERHGGVVAQRLVGRIPRRWRGVLSEDDVMQQTYMDAALSIRRFETRDDGSFRAWLTSLAERNLIDAMRHLGAEKRGGARRRVEAPPAPAMDGDSCLALYEWLGATSSTPSRHAAREEAVDALGQALEQLPPVYRRVVEMYDLGGQGVEEVASSLGRSKGAVYMLRARALQRLAGIMGTASKYLSRA